MAKKTTEQTNEEILNAISDPDALPDFANFEEEQLAFPPYWEAGEGKWFYGMVVALDDRDPQFQRYVLQAEMPVTCAQGKKKGRDGDYHEVQVGKDEFFTLSCYGGLPLDRYIGYRVLVKCTGTRDVGQPQPMYTFSLKVSPEDKKLLMVERKQNAAVAMAKFREGRKNANALPARGQSSASKDDIPFA